MADTVHSRVLENGARNLVIQCTNFSDGTGETNVTKVSAATYGLTASSKIRMIDFVVPTGLVQVQWKASSNVDAAILAGTGTLWHLRDTQGIWNDAGSGVTDDITFTTQGFKAVATAASGYNIILYIIKGT